MTNKYKKEVLSLAVKENLPLKESLLKILWADYYCASPPLFRLLNNIKFPAGTIVSDHKRLEILMDLIIKENE
tara:strand:- start:1943 stop:2161 length:219 start_codon:yes stop_codon:yes gene_type:complete